MNMSYCRFHNTLQDLRQCRDALDNGDELSPEEQKARDKLIDLCLEIAENYSEETL